MEELTALIAGLPGADLVTPAMKTAALQHSRIPDAEGRWPGQPGYVDTYDVYYAALSLLGFMQARPAVTSASSEGTSVSTTPTDWKALAAFFRSLSVICSAGGPDVLQPVDIPQGPHVYRTDMSGRGPYYGDVDTDLG